MAILQNKFIREDGSIIGSSVIISCKYTSEVNSQTNLTVGDTTAAEVEVEIRNLASAITAGEKLTYYQIEDGTEHLIGVFYAEAPTIATKNSVRFIAYDGKAKLAVDFSEWLNNHQDAFPMYLRSLVQAACEVAGVALAEDVFQFEGLLIPAFYAQGATSRQIVSWAAQIAGCFVSCKTNGEIFFDWYRETNTEITSTQFTIDGLSKSSYTTDLIRRVQFKQSTDDVGVIYPSDADGNIFSIAENGIAALLDGDTLSSIAEYLYNKFETVAYTPLTVKLPRRTASIRAGEIISVTDGNGNTVTTYVMKVYLDSGGTTISSTGDQNYADKAAVSSEKYKNIPGKIFILEKSVDGLRIANKDTTGRLSELEMDVEGIGTAVQDAQGNITQLQQNAGQVSVIVQDEEGGTLATYINKTQWAATYKDKDGNEISGLTFDAANKRFILNAAGQFGGVGDDDSFIQVNGSTMSLFTGKGEEILQIGYENKSTMLPSWYGNGDFSYIRFVTSLFGAPYVSQIMRFLNGLWIGNDDVDALSTGAFSPTANSSGIFIDNVSSKVTVYNGEDGQDIYTGEAIAKFG